MALPLSSSTRAFDVRVSRIAATLTLLWIAGCSDSSPLGSDLRTRDDSSLPSLSERIAALQQDQDPGSRTRGFLELAERLDGFTDRELNRSLSEDPGRLRPVELLLLVEGWSRTDPAAASRWAHVQPEPIGMIMRQAVLFVWSRSDPAAALASIRTLSPADLNTLIPGWVASGQPGLEEFVLSLGFDPNGQAAIAAYADARVGREGAQAVIEWAEAQADRHQGKMLLNIYRQTLGKVSLADPDAAFAFCERHCEGPHGKALRQKIAQNAARTHGRKTMEWLARSRGADERELAWAVRAGFQSWIASANAEALAWAAAEAPAHRTEDWFNPVVLAYVNGTYRKRPAEAIEWAEWIKDLDQREAVLIEVAQRWRELEPAAADAWLASSDLSEPARMEARQPPRSRRNGPS